MYRTLRLSPWGPVKRSPLRHRASPEPSGCNFVFVETSHLNIEEKKHLAPGRTSWRLRVSEILPYSRVSRVQRYVGEGFPPFSSSPCFHPYSPSTSERVSFPSPFFATREEDKLNSAPSARAGRPFLQRLLLKTHPRLKR